MGTDLIAVLLKLRDPTVCFAFKYAHHCVVSLQQELYKIVRDRTRKGNKDISPRMPE